MTAPSKACAPATLFRGIRKLATLEKVAAKGGRSTTEADLGWIHNAAMLVRGGRIVAVGSNDGLLSSKAFTGDQTIQVDLGGRVVIPAFVECHTHLIYAGNRAGEFERRNRGESYQSIAASGGGILATVVPTRNATEKELVAIGQARADRYLRQGVTTVEAKSGYGLNTETEFRLLKASAQITGARIVPTYLGAHAVPKDFANAEAYVDHLVDEALPRLSRENLARRVDIFVEKGYFDRELAHRYLAKAKSFGFDLVIHADQMTLSGGSDLAVEFNAKSADHLVQITEREIGKLADSEVTCVCLPTSDLYMRCAYPPARALIDAGARVALATDLNPGTAPSQDLAICGVLARLEMKMTLPEVIAAYTVGPAFALGLERDLGALTPGRFADFSVLTDDLEDLFLEIGRMPIAEVYREGTRLI